MANDTYDLIRCTDEQWGNETMRRLAEHHFKEHPDCQFAHVYEHGGWWLGFRRDGSIWGTANDMAILNPLYPQPSAYSGTSYTYTTDGQLQFCGHNSDA